MGLHGKIGMRKKKMKESRLNKRQMQKAKDMGYDVTMF